MQQNLAWETNSRFDGHEIRRHLLYQTFHYHVHETWPRNPILRHTTPSNVLRSVGLQIIVVIVK